MMSSVFNEKNQLILCGLGIAGGLAALAAMLVTGDNFGYPGSAEYEAYERFNRLMVVFLLLQVCSLIAFLMVYASQLGWAGRLGLYVAIVGWLGMAAGTAEEFWLYSDLSYSEQNMRQVAYGVFSFGGLLSGVGLIFLGIDLFRRKVLPRVLAIALMLYVVFDIVFFFSGQSTFLSAALWSILLAILSFRENEKRIRVTGKLNTLNE